MNSITPKQMKVGFIGIGVMGISMAGHIMNAGYELYVYTRTASKADILISRGAKWCDTPSQLAEICDVVITMIGYPTDVEQMYFGEKGLIQHSKPEAILIDMTTSSPSLAKRIANEASLKGIHAIDAPVSGGDIGAKNAQLSIMVGGSQRAFELALPILQLMGNNIIRQGEAGAGQHTKMCNQIAIATNMIGVCEAIVYAENSGLDPRQVLKSIQSGAAGSWSLSNLAPRIIENNFEPGFYVKHFIKDMNIALQSAKDMGLNMPGLSLAITLYQELADRGLEDEGTQALYKVLTASSGE